MCILYWQHLLRYRWDELCIEEWSASSDVADLVARLHGATDISPSKNAIAALMAEVLIFVLHLLSCCALIFPA